MLKRRRKLSKDLQIRKKITTFAEEKLHLGIIAQASLASFALDLHFHYCPLKIFSISNNYKL